MSQLSNILVNTLDEAQADIGDITFVPASARNGLFTFKGKETESTVLAPSRDAEMKLSVRPGRAANANTDTQRIKRRVTIKVAVPIVTPGIVQGAAGDIVDTIDIDLTVSCPVETSKTELYSALSCIKAHTLPNLNPAILDAFVNGYEPY